MLRLSFNINTMLLSHLSFTAKAISHLRSIFLFLNPSSQNSSRKDCLISVFPPLCPEQKPLVSLPYKNLGTFGGCNQDLMLVVGQSAGQNTSKDKPTERHLFAMPTSKVSEWTRNRIYNTFSTIIIMSLLRPCNPERFMVRWLRGPLGAWGGLGILLKDGYRVIVLK